MNDINDLAAISDGPEPELPEGFIDRHPERGYADAELLSYFFKVTPRQIRSLAASGVLPRETDGPFKGKWKIMPTMDRWVEYKTAPPSAKSERLAAAQLRLMDRRIVREDLELMEMSDVLETIDTIAAAMLAGLDEAAAQSIAIVADPARAQLACANARENLVDQFAEQRAALIAGPKIKRARS